MQAYFNKAESGDSRLLAQFAERKMKWGEPDPEEKPDDDTGAGDGGVMVAPAGHGVSEWLDGERDRNRRKKPPERD